MHANECNKMFIIHTRVASCLFPREVPSNSPFECKVTEGVSGHAADFLLFSSSTTNKTTATESTKVGHVYELTITWTSCPFAEKQKVGGVSGNRPLSYIRTVSYSVHRVGRDKTLLWYG